MIMIIEMMMMTTIITGDTDTDGKVTVGCSRDLLYMLSS